MKTVIYTSLAPEPIGPYSQAVKVGNWVYLSGQIPKNSQTNTLVSGDIFQETQQVFANLQAVANASGGALTDIVKLTIFLTDLQYFPLVNEVMMQFFSEPFPARSTIQVAALPANARIEIEAVMALANS